MGNGVTRWAGAMVLALAAAACSSSHGTEGEDGGRTADASPGFDAGPRSGTDGSVVRPPREDGGVPEPAEGVVVCGATACAAGQECCLLTLACFDPADPDACTVPPEAAGDPGACVSNRDCGEGELCERGDIFSPDSEPAPACGGAVGHCVMERGPDLCGGFGDGVCGCDGRTYPDPCTASRAGVRVSWFWPCGTSPNDRSRYECDADHPDCMEGWSCDTGLGRCVENDPFIACGIDEQCPDGQYCCGIVGGCMPSDCPECCFVPPAGTTYPCLEDGDCAPLDMEPFGGPSRFYCAREACDGPGGCLWRESDCGGELAPVCGCDGTTYSNPCWASEAGVSIASDGECP